MCEQVCPTVDYQCIQTSIQILQDATSKEHTEPPPRFDRHTARISLQEPDGSSTIWQEAGHRPLGGGGGGEEHHPLVKV